jgi:hypothetical protein
MIGPAAGESERMYMIPRLSGRVFTGKLDPKENILGLDMQYFCWEIWK